MKTNKSLLLAVTAGVLVGFGILVWLGGNSSLRKEAPASGVSHSALEKPHSPVKGNPNAKVTIVEFLDPECEACRAVHPIVERLLADYEGKVRLVLRYMPFHGNSRLAATALEEAKEQGKFYEALNILFERQPQWADHAQPRPDLIFVFLKEVGVDFKSLDAAGLQAKHGWKVDLDYSDGIQAGVRMTPTFFVNGNVLSQIGYEPLRRAVETSLK